MRLARGVLAEPLTEGRNMADEKKKVLETHVAKVVRHKGPIVLPDEMTTETAIECSRGRRSTIPSPKKPDADPIELLGRGIGHRLGMVVGKELRKAKVDGVLAD